MIYHIVSIRNIIYGTHNTQIIHICIFYIFFHIHIYISIIFYVLCVHVAKRLLFKWYVYCIIYIVCIVCCTWCPTTKAPRGPYGCRRGVEWYDWTWVPHSWFSSPLWPGNAAIFRKFRRIREILRFILGIGLRLGRKPGCQAGDGVSVSEHF